MQSTDPASAWVNALDTVKEWPLWLFFALALSLSALAWSFSGLISSTYLPFIKIGAVVCWIFSGVRGGVLIVEAVNSHRSAKEANRRFHVTPIEQQCYWGASKQRDNSIVTQVNVHCMIKNRSPERLHIMGARLVKPKIKGEVLPGLVVTRAPNSATYGTPHVSGHFIAPGETLPVSATILIRGVPSQKAGLMRSCVEFSDADGHRERVKINLRSIEQPR